MYNLIVNENWIYQNPFSPWKSKKWLAFPSPPFATLSCLHELCIQIGHKVQLMELSVKMIDDEDFDSRLTTR
jgi:hypothetical protein